MTKNNNTKTAIYKAP